MMPQHIILKNRLGKATTKPLGVSRIRWFLVCLKRGLTAPAQVQELGISITEVLQGIRYELAEANKLNKKQLRLTEKATYSERHVCDVNSVLDFNDPLVLACFTDVLEEATSRKAILNER